VIFKSLIEIRVVFLEYHGAHIVDLDGKLAAVVCEGARGESTRPPKNEEKQSR
jgi:hypothetical protein